MAEKNVQYKLSFVANTQQAKESLNSLNNQLSQLGKNLDITKPLSRGVHTALNDVAKLQTALQNAVHVDTGALDFQKLSQQFKTMDISLGQLRTSMSRLGPEGRTSFNTLAQSILQAEVPIRKMGTLINGLWSTLKNTIKWQMSSALLQGFTKSIREAYTYAQDLDKTLTNIKVVSDLNNEALERFAKTANKAAKTLSTTTKEYTKASLIFFQQGLDENQVLERTNAVIKMANVTGETAEAVSSYMTAIWNNFDDGSKSLEHYADVITALGAATASSSEEIAGGLEKFAAIAETVGLSYEYATAALATVVAETRQSEDTVGTAFKTIFGRLQSLNLGESLDDDTTLTKYSNALMSVGVNIKQANGELKDMDQILDELGTKWNNLSKDEQVALANTVAGTRQYSNFMALMNNYQDAFKTNLETAYNAQGELNKQADEYAESWEAARNRVKASAEGVYDALFNEKDFIAMSNGLSKIIDLFAVLTKGAGGLAGIIPTLSAALMALFGQKLAQGLREIKYQFDGLSNAAEKTALAFKQEAYNQFKLNTSGSGYTWFGDAEVSTQANQVRNEIADNQMRIQNKLFANARNMSDIERDRLNALVGITNQFEEQVILLNEQQDKYKEMQGSLIGETKKQITVAQPTATATAMQQALKGQNSNWKASTVLNRISGISSSSEVETAQLTELRALLTAQGDNQLGKIDPTNMEKINTLISQIKNSSIEIKTLQENWTNKVQETAGEYSKIAQAQEKLYQMEKTIAKPTDPNAAKISAGHISTLKTIDPKLDTSAAEKQLADLQKLKAGSKEYEDAVTSLNGTLKTLAQSAMGSLNQSSDQLADNLRELGAECGIEKDKIEQLIDVMKKSARGQIDVNNATANYKERLKQLEQDIDKIKNKMHDWASVTVGVAQSINGVIGAINSLRSIDDIFSDESLSTGEKMLALLSTITSATMSLMFAYKGLMPLMDNHRAKKELAIKQQEKEIILDGANTLSGHAEANAERDQAKADLEHAGASKIGQGVQKQEIGTDIVNTATNKSNGKTGSWFSKLFKGGKGAKGASAAGGAGASAASVLGGLAVGIAIIAAASAIAVHIYTAEERAAEKAAKNAEAVRNAYTQVKSEVDSLQSSIKELGSAYENLETMTKGTQEWREAISSANEEAKKLIKSVKGLEYTVDANGLIKINEESLDRAYKELAKKEAGYEAMSLTADRIAKEKQITADKTAFNRQINGTGSDEEWVNFGNGMAAVGVGAGAGAAAGAIIGGGYGALIGMAAGAILGAITGTVGVATTGVETGLEKEALETVSRGFSNLSASQKEQMFATRESTVTMLQQMGVDDTLIDSLADNREALEELVRAEDELRMENIKLTKAILGETYQEEAEQYGFGADAILSAMAKETQEGSSLYNETYNKLDSKSDGFWGSLFGDKDWKDAVEEVSNNQFRVTKVWASNKALLERWNEEAQKWEKVSEEKMSKEDINKMITQAQLTSSLTSGDFSTVANKYNIEGLTNELMSIFGLTDADLLDSDKSHYQQILSDYVLGQDLDLTNLTYAEIEDVLSKTTGTAFGLAVEKAALNYDEARKNKNLKAFQEWHESTDEREYNEREAVKRAFDLSDADYDEYVKFLADSNQYLASHADLADDAAQRNLQLSESIEAVNKVLSDNIETLLTADKGSSKYITALSKVAGAMTTAFGVTFDSAYIDENLDEIIAAGEGNADAMREVYQDAAVFYAQQGDYTDGTKKVLTDFAINNNEALDKVEIGQSLANSGLSGVASLVNLAENGDMSIEELVPYLTKLGYDVKTMKGIDGQLTIDTEATKYIGTEAFKGDFEVISKSDYNNLSKTDRLLDRINKKLSDNSKKKDEAFGKQKLAYLDKEIDLLEQELQVYQEEEKILNSNLEKSKTELNDILARENFSAVYGPDGEISHFVDANGNSYTYNDLMENTRFQYKRDTLEKAYNQVNSDIDAVNENSDAQLDVQLNIADAEWEKIEYLRTVELMISEESIKHIEHVLSRLGDKWDNASARMLEYMTLLAEYETTFVTYYNQYQDLLNKYANKPQSDWTEEDIQALQKIVANMRGSEQDIRELLASVQENFNTAIEDVNDRLEGQIERLEKLNALANSYRNIVDLLSNTNLLTGADDLINKINTSNLDSIKKNITITQSRIDTNKKELRSAQEKLEAAKALGEDTVDFWLQEIERLETEGLELSTTLSEQIAEALEVATKRFEDQVTSIMNNLEKAMSANFGSFEYMQYAYNQTKKMKDLYLESYEKEYELTKLLRNISKDIDNATMLSEKENLRELEEEINALMESGAQVSAEELDILQKRYELKLAENALEESKNNKTQVQMVQSESGAWAYVYRANQEKVDEAIQDYEDKQYALQKANSDYIDQWTSNLLTLENSFSEGLNQVLAIEYKDIVSRNEAIRQYLTNSLKEFNAYATGLGKALGTNNLSGTPFSSFGTIENLMNSFAEKATASIDAVLEKQSELDTEQQTIVDMFTEDSVYNYLNNNLEKVADTSKYAMEEAISYSETLSSVYSSLAANLIVVQKEIATAMNIIETSTDSATASLQGLLTQLSGIEGVATGVFITGDDNEVYDNVIDGATVGYDTGGYTGAWGNSGKLAFLHEKELVLNQYDTDNMLRAIDLVRDVVGNYSLKNVTSVSSDILSGIVKSNNGALEQSVHITAEFPNATNHSEIEQAFENIVNMASQYAYRK